MLSTPWSREMGLQIPVVNAPMGGVAGGRFAAAVTAAGGLGMIGMGSSGSAAKLTAELAQLDDVGGPFGIGMVGWVAEQEHDLLDTAIAAGPSLISVSFTEDFAWVTRVHDAGILAATQIYDVGEARRAQDAGVDVLVARGAEGGGHGDTKLSILPLLDLVLPAVTVPVLAAGAIASGRSLAAVLAAGASGAWLGTCLAACPEALTPARSRTALLAAQGSDTVTTRVFDVGQNLPWPARFPTRALRNDFTGRWHDHEAELAADTTACAELGAAMAADDTRIAPVDAGMGVGLLTSARPVGEVLDQMCGTAERSLGGWGRSCDTARGQSFEQSANEEQWCYEPRSAHPGHR